MKAIFFVFIFSPVSLYAFRNKTKTSEEKTFKGETFCKSKSCLIRLEKTDIMLAETVTGSSILLQCKYCDDGTHKQPRIWQRQNMTTGLISEVEILLTGRPSRRRIKETALQSLIIRNVTHHDSGLYLCRYPYEDSLEFGFNYLIDVIDTFIEPPEGNLTDWKSYAETNLMTANEVLQRVYILEGTSVKLHFEVFSSWSRWSECELCTKKPKRFSVAHCRVRPVCVEDICSRLLENETAEGEAGVVRLLLKTSTQLPCRGHMLRRYIPDVARVVQNIPDFKQLAECDYYCPLGGEKNAAGERRWINMVEGDYSLIQCPGQHGNTEVRWEYKKRRLDPETWNVLGSPVLVDHFGGIHFSAITRDMAGKYACFVKGEKILEITVNVRRRSKFIGMSFFRHFGYLLAVCLACFVIFFSMIVVLFFRMKIRYRNTKMDVDGRRNRRDKLNVMARIRGMKCLKRKSEAKRNVANVEESKMKLLENEVTDDDEVT